MKMMFLRYFKIFIRLNVGLIISEEVCHEENLKGLFQLQLKDFQFKKR